MTTLDVTARLPERRGFLDFLAHPSMIVFPIVVAVFVGGILSNNARQARLDATALVEAGAAFETVERASVRDGLTLDASPVALSAATADLPAPPDGVYATRTSTGADSGAAFSHFGAVTRNVTINGRPATVPSLILKLSDASRIAKVCDAIPEVSGHALSDGYGCTSNPMVDGPLQPGTGWFVREVRGVYPYVAVERH